MKNKVIVILINVLLLIFNFSCSPSSDIEKWIKKEKVASYSYKNNISINNNIYSNLEIKKYNPPKYNVLSPFDASRLNLLYTQTGRKKEILEDFNLSDLNYLGYFKDEKGNITAYIKAKNIIYNEHVGNYIGKNNGKIIDIEPDKIIIDELIINDNGESYLKKNEILINNKS